MGVLGKDEVEELIEEYGVIYPFSHKLLDGEGYILTVKDEVVLQYLEHQNVISHEVIFCPFNLVAHLTAKSKYGRMGLCFLNSTKIHSGFIGRVVLELVNLNNKRESITIKRGEPLMHIEFEERVSKSFSPYDGEYQFQGMDEKEAEKFTKLREKWIKDHG